MTYQDDEIMDLVDDNDEVIGQIGRYEFQDMIHNNPPGSIRVADGFLMNGKGQLWIPRRTAHKKLAPNGLDFSVGEHVQTGETYEQAIVRGLKEELNIEVDVRELELLFVTKPTANLPLFQAVFLYRTDTAPIYNESDFSGFQWLFPQEVIDAIAKGENAKRNLAPTIKRAFL